VGDVANAGTHEGEILRRAAAELRGQLLHGQQTRTLIRRSPAGMNDKSGNFGAENGEMRSATAIFVKIKYQGFLSYAYEEC
jgi:hypothetical protein